MENVSPNELNQARIEQLIQSNSYQVNFLVNYQQGMLFVMLAILMLLRIGNLTYNTFFIDEAIYVNVGHEIMSGITSGDALSWMFGSYLYPIYVGLADMLGGELGVRISSVILGFISIIFLYLATKRVFGFQAALWSILIFGLSGISVNLGRQAVYDAMGVPLAAAALYFMVLAALEQRSRARWYAIAAGVALSLSFLAKYIGVFVFPITVLTGLALYLINTGTVWKLLRDSRTYYFSGTLALITGVYLLLTFDEVRIALQGGNSTQVVDRFDIIKTIVQEIGIVLVFAYAGLFMLAHRAYRRSGISRHQPRKILLFCLVLLGIIITLPLMQIYHFYSSNVRALWKHNVYTLVYLAPLCAYMISRTLHWLRRSLNGERAQEIRLLVISCLFVVLMFFTNNTMDIMWSYEYSWPNVTNTVDYLKAQEEVDLDNDPLVLSSVSTVYEYYLGRDPRDASPWFSNWFFYYENKYGLEGIEQAIEDCALDLVILDDYYTVDINEIVEPQLLSSGYIQIHSDLQELNSGDIIGTRIYAPAIHDNCSWRSN